MDVPLPAAGVEVPFDVAWSDAWNLKKLDYFSWGCAFYEDRDLLSLLGYLVLFVLDQMHRSYCYCGNFQLYLSTIFFHSPPSADKMCSNSSLNSLEESRFSTVTRSVAKSTSSSTLVRRSRRK